MKFTKLTLEQKVENCAKKNNGQGPSAFYRLFHPKITGAYEIASIYKQKAQEAPATETELTTALKKNTRKFEEIFKHSPIAIEIYSSDGKLVNANPSTLDLFGISKPSDIAGFDLFADPNVSEHVKKTLRETGSASYESEFDFDKLRKIGINTSKTGMLHLQISINKMVNGETCYIVQVVDITGRKKAEEARLADLEQYRTIIQTTKDGFWTIGLPGGKFTDVNETYCQMSGYTSAELLNLRILDLDAAMTPDEQAAQIKRIMENGSGIFETRHRRKDGSLFDVEISVTYQNTNDNVGLICFCRDITARKKTESELVFKNILFESQMEATLDAILIVDDKGKTVASNRLFAKMFGIPKALIDSRDDKKMINFVLSQFKDPDQFIRIVNHLYGSPSEGSIDELQFKNGVVIDRYSAPLIDDSKKVLGRIWHFRDITKSKSDQEKLQRALKSATEAITAKDKFFGIVAHDLKSPFNALFGFARMLKDDYYTLSDNNRLKFIDIILKSTEKTFQLLEQMLEWRNLNGGNMNGPTIKLNVRSSVDLAVSPLLPSAEKKHINLQINTNHTNVSAQEMMFGRVIANLVSNAIKFTPSDGKGVISISAVKTGNGLVQITVADNGLGMPDEILSTLFSSNHILSTSGTDGETGTGLGLSMVKTMVEEMGGKIWAETKVASDTDTRSGSKFHFTLPAM